MNRTLTQKDMIRQHLENGNRISGLEALNLFGCFRLAARIDEIRQELESEGKTLSDRFIKTPGGATIKEYWIDGTSDGQMNLI